MLENNTMKPFNNNCCNNSYCNNNCCNNSYCNNNCCNNNCCNNSWDNSCNNSCNNSWDNCCNNSWDKYRPPKYCISYCNVPIMNRQLGYTYNTCSRPQPFTSYTWHIQQPHNHLQQPHNHIQQPHNHLQQPHNHLQQLRNHLQQPHNHIQLNKYNKYEKKNCGCGK